MQKEFKCYHYDIANGAYLKPEIFKKATELAANAGFTHFLPYLENMIRLKNIEKACPSFAYTANDWIGFEKTAWNAGIELIPHFNVAGHSKEICKQYREFSSQDGELELDLSIEKVKKMIKGCLEEFCSFSQGNFFLIGGDEWQAPNHLLKKKTFNIAKTWTAQMNYAADILGKQGRTPIAWHDMLLHYPEGLKLLSRNITIAFWCYDEDSDYPALDMLHKMGFKTIMASGLCSGMLSGRRFRGIRRAVTAAEKYKSSGIMITSWTDCRWEKQQLNIPLTGRLIRKEKIPDEIVSAISVLELSSRVTDNHVLNKKLGQKLQAFLQYPGWRKYPEYKRYIKNTIKRNSKNESCSFLKYHYNAGPLLNSIINRKSIESENRFSCEIIKAFEHGEKLKIINEDESFVIYPQYGATLQNWQKNGIELIKHSFPSFASHCQYLPGGYRSYTEAGGLRPVWALGSYHNPCILWNRPFKWKVDKSTDSEIKIKLTQQTYHVEVAYTITIIKGISGFSYEVEAINKIDNAYGAFGFNFPLSVEVSELADICLIWNKGTARIKDQIDSFFMIPVHDMLTIKKNNCSVVIKSEPEKTAGCYVDWGRSFLTPDFHGIYRRIAKDDIITAKWSFSVN